MAYITAWYLKIRKLAGGVLKKRRHCTREDGQQEARALKFKLLVVGQGSNEVMFTHVVGADEHNHMGKHDLRDKTSDEELEDSVGSVGTGIMQVILVNYIPEIDEPQMPPGHLVDTLSSWKPWKRGIIINK